VSSHLGNRIIDGLIRYRGLWLALAVVFTGLAIYPSRQLSFEHSIESLYAPGNPRLVDYVKSKSLFGGDEFVFIAYTDPELLEAAGQERLNRLTGQVRAVPGVVEPSVQSLATVLQIANQPLLQSQRARIMEFARGLLLGDDNKSTAIALRLEDESNASVPRSKSIDELRRIAAECSLPTYIAGEPILVHDMFRYAQDDGQFMGWAASALLILVILFFLRDVRSIVLPFVIVQMTILWTKAGLWASHMPLTMVSSVLGSLITIIGVSTVVYLSLYLQKLREEMDREAAFRRMLQIVGMDIVWVCLATAAGFAAQLTSHLHPVRSFGVTMVMASLLVLVAIFLVLPGGMLIGPDRGPPLKPRGDAEVNRSLHRVTAWVLKHPIWMGVATALALAVGISGLFRLQVETDFTRNFRASSPVVASLDFFESRLGGAGLWEVNFAAPQTWDSNHLDKVRQLAEQLRQIQIHDSPGLTKVVAVTDGLDLIPRVPILIPNTEAQSHLLSRLQPEFVPSLYNAEQSRMRIVLRAREHQSSEHKAQLIARVTELAQATFPRAIAP
jgi:predicted RND superfamily exporter protein